MADHDDDFSRTVEEKFEWLLSKVPGLSEYRGRDRLRDQDRVLREAAVSRLGDIKSGIDRLKEQALGAGGLSALGELDRLSGRVDVVANELRYTPGGNGPLFGGASVSSADLEQWYAMDQALLEKTETAARQVTDAAAEGPSAVNAARVVAGVIEELAALVRERREALERRG